MILIGGQLGGRHFVDPCSLSLGGVVPKQLASPAVLAQEGVVLLQVLGGYRNHQPLQGIREGFGGSGGVVGHDANLYPIAQKYGESREF
jgi:hypothetical protein